MNAETFQNLPPLQKKLLIIGAALFAVFWIYMISSTLSGGIEARREAEASRRRMEHSMEVQKAAQEAMNDSRRNLKLPF